MVAGLGCLRWTEYNLFVSFRLSRCLLSLTVLVFFLFATFLKPSCVHSNRHTYNILSIAALCSPTERTQKKDCRSVDLANSRAADDDDGDITMTSIITELFVYSQLRRLTPINIVPIKFQNSQTNTVCVLSFTVLRYHLSSHLEIFVTP